MSSGSGDVDLDNIDEQAGDENAAAPGGSPGEVAIDVDFDDFGAEAEVGVAVTAGEGALMDPTPDESMDPELDFEVAADPLGGITLATHDEADEETDISIAALEDDIDLESNEINEGEDTGDISIATLEAELEVESDGIGEGEDAGDISIATLEDEINVESDGIGEGEDAGDISIATLEDEIDFESDGIGEGEDAGGISIAALEDEIESETEIPSQNDDTEDISIAALEDEIESNPGRAGAVEGGGANVSVAMLEGDVEAESPPTSAVVEEKPAEISIAALEEKTEPEPAPTTSESAAVSIAMPEDQAGEGVSAREAKKAAPEPRAKKHRPAPAPLDVDSFLADILGSEPIKKREKPAAAPAKEQQAAPDPKPAAESKRDLDNRKKAEAKTDVSPDATTAVDADESPAAIFAPDDEGAPLLVVSDEEPAAVPSGGLEALRDENTLKAFHKLAGGAVEKGTAEATLRAALAGEAVDPTKLPDARTIAMGVARALVRSGVDLDNVVEAIIEAMG